MILVNGHGYKKFIDIFLKPFFVMNINRCLEDIGNLNIEIIDKLGPKTVKRSDIKYKRGSTFPCTGCDFTAQSITALKKHKNIEHTISLKSSNALVPKQSTRNNSIVDKMMIEDMSIS